VSARGALALLLAGALAAACATSAPKPKAQPKPRPRPPVLSTPQADQKAGEQASQSVEAAIGVVKDPALRGYVQAVGARLAREAPGFRYDYQFEIVDDWEPNAFALPGGFIYVSRGALALTASEDELANVLAHEIAHVASRHAAARQQVAGNALMATLQWRSLAAYSRDLEASADRLGQGLAALAGYDPNGMTRFLAGLDRIERIRTGTARTARFLDTHPGTGTRIAEMGQRAGQIAWQPRPGVSSGPADHLARLEGLVVEGDASQGMFTGTRFVHPELGFTLRFPDGWTTQNTASTVGALAPDRRMRILLEIAGEGADAAAAAQAWLEGLGRGFGVTEASPVRVTGREAFRVRGRSGPAAMIATFVPFRGLVYRITCEGTDAIRLDALCTSVTRSFRPLTPELLAGARERRLHLATARAGESLAELSAREGNLWSPLETAAWNGLEARHPFAGGERVKLVREGSIPAPGGPEK
jgi:predicted Zn-dependent protease